MVLSPDGDPFERFAREAARGRPKSPGVVHLRGWTEIRQAGWRGAFRALVTRGHLAMDSAGHYARPDVFHPKVDTRVRRDVTFG